MLNIGSATTDTLAVNVKVTITDVEGANVVGRPETVMVYPVGKPKYVTLNVPVTTSPVFVIVTVFAVTESFSISPQFIDVGNAVKVAGVNRFPVVSIVSNTVAAYAVVNIERTATKAIVVYNIFIHDYHSILLLRLTHVLTLRYACISGMDGKECFSVHQGSVCEIYQ